MSKSKVDFKKVPYFDENSVTYEEYRQVLQFIKNGDVRDTRKNSKAQLLKRLENIGYIAEKHATYTFQYDDSDGKYGPDIRHIFIVELDNYFSYI